MLVHNEKAFIACIIGLFNRLTHNPTEDNIINKIRMNLLPYYIPQLAVIDIHIVEELSDLCQKLEESIVWNIDSHLGPVVNYWNQILVLLQT